MEAITRKRQNVSLKQRVSDTKGTMLHRVLDERIQTITFRAPEVTTHGRPDPLEQL